MSSLEFQREWLIGIMYGAEHGNDYSRLVNTVRSGVGVVLNYNENSVLRIRGIMGWMLDNRHDRERSIERKVSLPSLSGLLKMVSQGKSLAVPGKVMEDVRPKKAYDADSYFLFEPLKAQKLSCPAGHYLPRIREQYGEVEVHPFETMSEAMLKSKVTALTFEDQVVGLIRPARPEEMVAIQIPEGDHDAADVRRLIQKLRNKGVFSLGMTVPAGDRYETKRVIEMV